MTAEVLAAVDALEDMAATCSEWAVERFGLFGPHDAQGATLWNLATFIREQRIPHLSAALGDPS